MKIIYISILAICLFGCVISNNSLNDNTKAKNAKVVLINQPANILRTKYLENGDKIRVFASFLLPDTTEAETFKAKYIGNYGIIMDYAMKDKAELRNIALNLDAIHMNKKLVSFYFDIPKPKSELLAYVVKIEISERGSTNKLQNELVIRNNSIKTGDNFALFTKNGERIILNNFVDFNDSVVVKSLDDKEMAFTMVRYKHEFDPAMSPLAVGQKPNPKPLFVDTLFQISTNKPFVLGQKGLFYFIKDTTDRSGFSAIGVDNRYPKYTQASQLTKPLVYLTTNQEYQSLNNSADAKRNLDQFWLGLNNGNQSIAKKSIKGLYRKVEEANYLFSSYKEGWKTDKGMVYIIMGKPDNIRFLKEKEIWVYTKNSKFSEINFTFTRRPNQFIEDHFELSRFAEFQPIWYPAVEAWRNGEAQ